MKLEYIEVSSLNLLADAIRKIETEKGISVAKVEYIDNNDISSVKALVSFEDVSLKEELEQLKKDYGKICEENIMLKKQLSFYTDLTPSYLN